MGLGVCETFTIQEARQSLARAREKAAECRDALDRGLDPLEEKHARRAAQIAAAKPPKVVTFKDAADSLIKAKRPTWKDSGKSEAQWNATLETYAYPVLAKLGVDEVTKDHVVQVLTADDLWTTKTETAKRLQNRIENILDHAKAHGWRNGHENPARWRGHLDMILPRPSEFQQKKRFPSLPYKDVPEFIENLQRRTGSSVAALEFYILIGGAVRTTPILEARWDWIDWQGKIFTAHGLFMKGKKNKADELTYRVPLSEAAVQTLKGWKNDIQPQMGMPKAKRSDYIFPGGKPGRPLSNMAMVELMKGMGYTDKDGRIAVPHGFRQTLKNWAHAETQYPRELTELALAHRVKGVEARYLTDDALERRRELLNDWGRFCDGE